jgi:amidase
MGEFIYKSATELAEIISSGEATSTDVVKDHLEQIKKHNPALDAVVILLEEQALKEAARCDEEARRGQYRGPLHGVPMTIKEQYWLKGTKTTVNFKMYKDWTAPEDAVIVDRLRRAGAVIMGKTNVPKNLTDYQVSGDIYPECKNPYNPEYSPGGSSGGSATALATGMTPVELGGDFGGSIRNPSNWCGLYGLKPTENTIPRHGNICIPEGARGFVFHMATAGPMARTPTDMELVWEIIQGPHKGDRTVPGIEWKNTIGKSLRDYRVAWVDGWPGYETSDETRSLIRNFAEQLRQKDGHSENAGPAKDLHERSLALWVRLFAQLTSQDVPRLIRPFMKMQMRKGMLNGFTKFKKELNKGFKNSFIYYSETMGIRAALVAEWEQFFERFDLLVCPMSYGPAIKRSKTGAPIHYDGKKLVYLDYAWPYLSCFNASGHPGINIPLGIGKEGLPVGVQVIGPYWSEPELIQFAKLVSGFTPGFIRPEGY